MATIFYSTAGEGRGHATRVRAIVESLRERHSVVVFAPGDAFDLLEPAYRRAGDVRVVCIPGLRFGYAPNGSLSPVRTTRAVAAFAAGLPGLVGRLVREIEAERPALAITDFEPALPRAARRAGVPFVSLDHQHFLSVSDLSHLPPLLRARGEWMGRVVDCMYGGQRATIVSSFFFPRLRVDDRRVRLVGPILRPSVLAVRPERGAHIVVYVRRAFAFERLLDALVSTRREVRCYGLGLLPARANLRFLPIDEQRFVEDLASSDCLVTTAGNQLLGEALFLRKPILAFPEPGNPEQRIHGHFLEREETGEMGDVRTVDGRTIAAFLDRKEDYRSRIDSDRMNGNGAALAALAPFLPASLPPEVALV